MPNDNIDLEEIKELETKVWTLRARLRKKLKKFWIILEVTGTLLFPILIYKGYYFSAFLVFMFATPDIERLIKLIKSIHTPEHHKGH